MKRWIAFVAVILFSAGMVLFAPGAAHAAVETANRELTDALYWLGIIFVAGCLALVAYGATRPPAT